MGDWVLLNGVHNWLRDGRCNTGCWIPDRAKYLRRWCLHGTSAHSQAHDCRRGRLLWAYCLYFVGGVGGTGVAGFSVTDLPGYARMKQALTLEPASQPGTDNNAQ